MAFQVVDAQGREIELDDDAIVPDGCSLHLPAMFMDSATRAVIAGLKRRNPPLTDYNPNHGPDGKFTGGGGGGGSGGGKSGGHMAKVGGAVGAAIGKKLGHAAGTAVGRKLAGMAAPHEAAPKEVAPEVAPSSLASRVKNFVTGPGAEAVANAAKDVLHELDQKKHDLIASAVLAGLQLYTKKELPPAAELAAHAAIVGLSKQLGVQIEKGYEVIKTAVGNMMEQRKLQHDAEPDPLAPDPAQSDDPELDAALMRLWEAIKQLEGKMGNNGNAQQGDQLTDAQQAYLAYKARLDTANGAARRSAAPARSQPMSEEGSWVRPSKRRTGKGTGYDSAADAADPNERAREAYEARNVRLRDGWKKKPHGAGPWTPAPPRPFGQPAWVRHDGSAPPAIGPSGGGRSPYRGQHQDAGTAAYVRMCDRLSTAYLKNRKPFVPEAVP